MKVPEYVLKEAHEWKMDDQTPKTLPAGTFVKPVEERWVPPHVKEAWAHHMKWARDPQVYVYSYYGFLVVPASIIRRIE